MDQDIVNKIKSDFGAESIKAIELMNSFEKKHKMGSRITRCIIHLSNGKFEKLFTLIDDAIIDWRDIINRAESYDFQFNKSFDDQN